jgi:tRNA (cytidine/uridine-2'-O-)-methyltransferase
VADSITLKAIEPPLVLVLVSPQIPPNTGNVARLCAVTGCRLVLVEPLGFSIADKELKRAGLDYWDKVFLKLYKSWEEYVSAHVGVRRWLFTARAGQAHWDVAYAAGDHLVFGSETKGLGAEVLSTGPNVTLPMMEERRSLNLSTAVGVAAYEALRQLR